MQRTSSPALFYAIFFLSGISVMVLSVVLPHIQPALPDAVAANMVAAQFAGQLLGPFVVIRSTRTTLLAGLSLSLISAALIALLSLPPLWLLAFYGLGMGITMTATNLLAGEEAAAENRASRIEMLNAFWPLGAACASFCVHLVPRPNAVYWLVAGGHLIVLGAVLLRRPQSVFAPTAYAQQQDHSLPHLARLSLLALFAVGLESAVSNWAPTFASRITTGGNAAGIASTLFWVGILAGRTVASFILTRIRWSIFALGSTLIALFATLAVAVSTGASVYVAVFIAAFGTAPIYPVIIARCLQIRGRSAIFVSAGVGSAFLPWVVGTISAHSALEYGLLAAPVTAVLLFFALLKERNVSGEVAA